MMTRVIGLVLIVLGALGVGLSQLDEDTLRSLALTREDESPAPQESEQEPAPQAVDVVDEPAAAPQITSVDSADVEIFERSAPPTNPEALPWVDVTSSSEAVLEDDNQASFVVTLSKPTKRPIVIIFSTVDGSAESKNDYIAQRGIVTFDPGIVSAEINTPLVDDDKKEPDETFTIVLNGAPNAVNFRNRQATTIIRDND